MKSKVSTDAISWNSLTEAAPLKRAPLLLICICLSSPASKLIRMTLRALHIKDNHTQKVNFHYSLHKQNDCRRILLWWQLIFRNQSGICHTIGISVSGFLLYVKTFCESRQYFTFRNFHKETLWLDDLIWYLLCCVYRCWVCWLLLLALTRVRNERKRYHNQDAKARQCQWTDLRILNQRRSNLPSLKGTLAPWCRQASTRGGRNASRSRTFQKLSTIRHFASASCTDSSV